MRNHLSVFATQIRLRPFCRSAPLLALLAALPCTPVRADAIDGVAQSNVSSAPQETLSWMSGGIGDEARDEMRQAAAAYNVHVLFSDRRGSYLASIPFSVAPRNGQAIHSGVSEGPLLYLKLPPGSYQIAAEIDGVWQSKRIAVGTSGRAAKVSFVARGE